MIIGISGNSGCGKTTLAKRIVDLTNNKAIHLDIDKVGHEVLTLPKVQRELVKAFGDEVVENGVVNRKKLGKIVFESNEEMDKLTEITWEPMKVIINKCLEDNKDKIVILDWILLPITEYFDKCDIKVLLDIPYKVRKERALKRDGITEEAFDLREKGSVSFDESKFDYVLKSNEKEDVEEFVRLL